MKWIAYSLLVDRDLVSAARASLAELAIRHVSNIDPEMQFIPYESLLAYCLCHVPVRVEQMIAQPDSIIRILALTITVLLLGSACSSLLPQSGIQQSKSTSVSGPASIGERAAAVALHQVGVPYRYGGSNPGGFDCSGLVQYAYSQAGMPVARTTAQMWSTLRTVTPGKLRPGDVLFFRIDGKMSHVGMYIGGQRFVHAPSSGRTVTVANLQSSFYRAAFIRAGRPN